MRSIYICILSMVLLFGCADVINVEPENDTTFTNYFKTTKDAEALLTSLQLDIRSMMCETGEQNPHLFAGEMIDSAVSRYISGPRTLDYTYYVNKSWEKFYRVINSADLILDNLHRFPLTEEELKPWELQACFAKGVAYFLLAQRWGEVPITKGTTYFGKLARSSVHDVLEEATKWALKALELPVYEELVDDEGKSRTTKQYGSKGAAAALLAHLYAWRATIEEQPEYLVEAERYCTMIIENQAGNYALAASPEAVCTEVMKRGSRESIWEVHRTLEDDAIDSYSSAYASEVYVGIPTYYTNINQYYNLMLFKSHVREMFDPEDRRREAYFWGVEADSLFTVQTADKILKCVLSYGTNDHVVGKFRIKERKETYINKFRYGIIETDPYWGTQRYLGMDMNKVIWRLADIMLLRAECRARQNNPDAVIDLNEIRKRAYGNDVHKYTAAEGDLQLAIFREREKELLFEDHRFYDIRRNGIDYVRRELPEAFGKLTDQDIKDGALYMDIALKAMTNNDLMRHNVYWNKFLQK